MVEVVTADLFEFSGWSMYASPYLLFGECGEQAFNLVQPGGRRGGEMHMKAWGLANQLLTAGVLYAPYLA